MKRVIRRVVIPGAAAAVIGAGGFAFMASNTVAETYAGQGSGKISGYTVSDVHYHLIDNGSGVGQAMFVGSVTFSLDHAVDVSNLRAVVYNTVNTPAGYNNCSITGGSTDSPTITCKSTGNMQTAKAASKLEVTAAQ